MRILIVEDEQIIAADLEDQLTDMGHRVIGIAACREEALQLSEREKPELVMMDFQLAGEMSGNEFAQTIRDTTGAGIIFITAFPGVFLRNHSKEDVHPICVGKPFSRFQIEAAVSAASGAG